MMLGLGESEHSD